jgi:hypothetical protein
MDRRNPRPAPVTPHPAPPDSPAGHPLTMRRPEDPTRDPASEDRDEHANQDRPTDRRRPDPVPVANPATPTDEDHEP